MFYNLWAGLSLVVGRELQCFSASPSLLVELMAAVDWICTFRPSSFTGRLEMAGAGFFPLPPGQLGSDEKQVRLQLTSSS